MTDHNDIFKEEGAQAVRDAIDLALEQPPAEPPPDAAAILKKAIQQVRDGDVGAPFEEEVIKAAQVVYVRSRPEYMRLRKELKASDKGVLISDWEKLVKGSMEAEEEKAVADEIVELILQNCELFHDQDGVPYAIIEVAGVRQTWPIESKHFREWVSMMAYRESGRVPSETALRMVVMTLAGKAKFDGPECPVYLRAAFHDGAYWIDLCDDEWRVIRITCFGWEIVKNSPVRFRRTSSMRSLPVPAQGGKIAPLWAIINVPEADRLMLLTVVLECFRPNTPYPVLELVGEQGSAKSTAQHYLRELIDPNQANNRAAPKTTEDVIVAAQNAHVVSYENLSHLSAAFQDCLCVLATGGGYAKREFYTNFDESVVNVMKPVLLNGIAVIATQPDLGDRTVHFTLPAIAKRITANDLAKRFEAHRDQIFGGLLDLMVRALVLLPAVTAENRELPRMADFALLGEAVYRAHGFVPGAFLAYYADRRRDTVHRTLDSSPVGAAILSYLDKQPSGYTGTVKGLLEVLTRYRPDGDAWPRSAKGLADAFRRVAPALRLVGIHAAIADKPARDGYHCELKPLPVHARDAGQPAAAQVHDVHQVHTPAAQATYGEHGELGEPECDKPDREAPMPARADGIVEGAL